MVTLSFIIPFRSRVSAENWDAVSQLLCSTVENLLNQTCREIEVHIIGHDYPSVPLPGDSRMHFHEVEEPVPFPLNRTVMRRDRRRKIVMGCMEAAKSNPEYIMPIDADDRIHPDLAIYLRDQDHHPAWILRKGYVVNMGMRRYYRSDNYDHLTGSSCLLSLRETGIPATTSLNEFMKCYWFLGHHKVFVEDMQSRGIHPRDIPFHAGAYLLGYNDNLSNEMRTNIIKKSRFILRYLFRGKRINAEITEPFGKI